MKRYDELEREGEKVPLAERLPKIGNDLRARSRGSGRIVTKEELDDLWATVMFLETPAVVAIVASEPNADVYANRLAAFGKGRPFAGQNFGDCLSYPTAELYGLPMLFKGEDFAAINIERA